MRHTGKFVQCLYTRDPKAVIDIERAHIDSDFQFKQDYEIRVRRFMDLKPTATEDLREMQDTKPLVLWMRLMMRHSETHAVPEKQRKHIHHDIAEKLSGTDLFVYEVLDSKSPRFELCVTDMPPARMRKLCPVRGDADPSEIIWLFRSVKHPNGVIVNGPEMLLSEDGAMCCRWV